MSKKIIVVEYLNHDVWTLFDEFGESMNTKAENATYQLSESFGQARKSTYLVKDNQHYYDGKLLNMMLVENKTLKEDFEHAA